MIWQPEAALSVLWVGMAAWQAHLIDQQRPIKHGWWAALSGVLIAAGCIWSRLTGWPLVFFAVAQGCGRLVLFNIALNAFRHQTIFYTSKFSTSILDKIEMRLFGDRIGLFEGLLLIIYLILQFFL